MKREGDEGMLTVGKTVGMAEHHCGNKTKWKASLTAEILVEMERLSWTPQCRY